LRRTAVRNLVRVRILERVALHNLLHSAAETAELSPRTFCTLRSEFSSRSGPAHAGGWPAQSSST
jgi:hypothetical protein